MPQCRRCGTQLQEGSRFCSCCGLGVETQSGNYGSDTANKGQSHYYGGTNSDYSEPRFDPRDIEDNRVLSILCYFNLLLLIPLLTRPYSDYIKFHANQGILLLLASIVSSAVLVIPIIGWLAGFVGGVFCVICLIIGVINSINGRAKLLPIIGKYTVLR